MVSVADLRREELWAGLVWCWGVDEMWCCNAQKKRKKKMVDWDCGFFFFCCGFGWRLVGALRTKERGWVFEELALASFSLNHLSLACTYAWSWKWCSSLASPLNSKQNKCTDILFHACCFGFLSFLASINQPTYLTNQTPNCQLPTLETLACLMFPLSVWRLWFTHDVRYVVCLWVSIYNNKTTIGQWNRTYWWSPSNLQRTPSWAQVPLHYFQNCRWQEGRDRRWQIGKGREIRVCWLQEEDSH